MSYALPLYGDTLLCVSGYEPFCAHQTYCPALGIRGTMLLYEALSFSRESNMDRPPLEGSMRMPVMLTHTCGHCVLFRRSINLSCSWHSRF